MGSDTDDISGKADKQEFQHACRGPRCHSRLTVTVAGACAKLVTVHSSRRLRSLGSSYYSARPRCFACLGNKTIHSTVTRLQNECVFHATSAAACETCGVPTSRRVGEFCCLPCLKLVQEAHFRSFLLERTGRNLTRHF
jgi:hypothetical protein